MGSKTYARCPLTYWERLGGAAAYCHLEGSQGFVGALVGEIPAGKSLRPIRHLYETQVLILEGRGATQFWSDSTAIESGTYKKAHRHGSGAQVIVLKGKGYSLMWPPGGDFVRVDWQKGSLLVPPEGWYHHHFTTSREAARHLALRRGLRGIGIPWLPNVSEHEGGNLLEHEDEPPEIRAMYEADLAREGIPLRMGPIKRAR